MNPTEYQRSVARTCATQNAGEAEMLKLALVGLQDELGEIAGPLKKYLWHGHALDRGHLQEEIGDVLWYLTTLCNVLGFSLTDVMQGNSEKLHHRYPNGFSMERSRQRSEVTQHTNETHVERKEDPDETGL